MDINTAVVNSLLDEMFRNTEYTQPTTVYLAAWSGDPFNGGSEVGTPGSSGYSRSAIAFSAASSRSIANSGAVQVTMPSTLPANTAVTHLGLHSDATTPGTTTLMARVPILGTAWEVTVDAATDTFSTGVAHGLAVDDRIICDDLGPATTPALPAGITAGTVYYVKTVPSSSTFTLSTTAGGAGATLDVTASGGCIARKLNVQTFNASNILQVAIGAVVVRM